MQSKINALGMQDEEQRRGNQPHMRAGILVDRNRSLSMRLWGPRCLLPHPSTLGDTQPTEGQYPM